MNALTTLALGLIGQLKPLPPVGDAMPLRVALPTSHSGGMPLMSALSSRQSVREFSPEPLPEQVRSDFLWAAGGINRHDLDGRTAPSAMNAQEVLLYVAMPQGLFLYEPKPHALRLVVASDVRRVTGSQDFVDTAPLDLVFVADHARMRLVPAAQREAYAHATDGAMAQNVYLYCASEGLATVIRAWVDRDALARCYGAAGRPSIAVVADGGCDQAGPGCVSPLLTESRRAFCLLTAGALMGRWVAAAPTSAVGDEALPGWSEQFAREVDRRLDVPRADQRRYILLLEQALSADALAGSAGQSFVLVDRSPQVQAAMVLVRTQAGGWHWLGAAAVSTGKTGRFKHFLSPLGAFAHSLDNPDFRAEGTFNKHHIRGYGLRGRRVFDFGWQLAERGWGDGGTSKMRLQMHATDPRVLEPRLGRVASEGCIRIPATLNVFLDDHGVLDADYEAAAAGGQRLWILKASRQTMPWPGRLMVIVDSQAVERPAWSP